MGSAQRDKRCNESTGDFADVAVRRADEGASAFVGGGLLIREERESALDLLLAPGATRPLGAGDRARPEEPDPYRLCFERDLDRVKHSRPWRRLAGKCQVFVAPEDDHLRTRLTHAVEVAQVATGIARVAEPLRAARRGDRARGTTAVTGRRVTRRRRRSRRTSPARATTTRCTAPTSRSPVSTCAARRSTACATTRGGVRRRPRPRARWWRGPTGSPTCATTSRTRSAPGSSSPPTSRRWSGRWSAASDREQVGTFVLRGARRDRPHRPRRDDRAGRRRARCVPRLQLRADLPPARVAPAGRTGDSPAQRPRRPLRRRTTPDVRGPRR